MKKVKRRKCKECKQLFEPKYTSVQMVCSTKCAIEYSKRTTKETKEKNNNALLKLETEKKYRVKLSTLLKSVQTLCHEYIRLRDKYKPCISCNTQWHKDFQAGHYFKAELFSSLKFDEYNINGQCVQCNIRKEGNVNEYSLKLPYRIGEEKFNELTQKAEQYKQDDFKWNVEDLIELKKYYQIKIKEFKNK